MRATLELMSEAYLTVGPVSVAVTRGVKVEVLARHVPEHSKLAEGQWVFQYTVRITNEGEEQVQLVSRHWLITDAVERTREVKGAGVVGKQPVLQPGESFEYSSWCPLETPTGIMRGTYRMVTAQGEEFEAEVAPFALKAPYTIH